MSRKLIITALAVVLSATAAAPTFAQEDAAKPRANVIDKLDRTVEATVNTVDTPATAITNDVKAVVEETSDQRRERIEARKAELKQRMELRAAERKEKLEGRRLAQCQNRQTSINELLVKSASTGQAKFARIETFETAIKQFYVNQELTSEAYDAAVIVADEKRELARTAMQGLSAQQFNCEDVDATKPSDTIKTAREAKRTALKEYRDSVQEVLKAVRAAFAAKTEATDEA